MIFLWHCSCTPATLGTKLPARHPTNFSTGPIAISKLLADSSAPWVHRGVALRKRGARDATSRHAVIGFGTHAGQRFAILARMSAAGTAMRSPRGETAAVTKIEVL